MTRLGFSYKEAGRLTLRKFSKFYENYKTTFDLELRLTASNTTYAELRAKQLESEEWIK